MTVPEVTRAAQKRYDVVASPAVKAYVGANYVILLLATTAFLWSESGMAAADRLLGAGLLLITLLVCGALFEKRRWAVPLEAARVLGVVAAVVLVRVA